MFLTKLVLTVVMFLTKLVLTVVMFLTEVVLTVLMVLTEIVLTVLIVLTEFVLAVQYDAPSPTISSAVTTTTALFHHDHFRVLSPRQF
jgi:hypothetical protein